MKLKCEYFALAFPLAVDFVTEKLLAELAVAVAVAAAAAVVVVADRGRSRRGVMALDGFASEVRCSQLTTKETASCR